MKQRIISGLIMAPLLIVIFIGGIVLKVFAFLLSILAVREFFKAHKADDILPSLPIAIASAIVLYSINLLKVNAIFYLFWLLLSVFGCLLYMFNIKKRITEDATITITGIVYIIFSLFHLAWMTDFTGYEQFVWIVVITAFVTDIGAYFCGFFFGKYHLFGQGKLCPEISPKKTREGAVGGILLSAIFCTLFGIIFTDGLWLHCLIMGIIGSIFAQLGDLTASIFKRNLKIKDYGHLIPGHGGVLDRIDSILFTAPAICWYMISFVMN